MHCHRIQKIMPSAGKMAHVVLIGSKSPSSWE